MDEKKAGRYDITIITKRIEKRDKCEDKGKQ